MQRSRKCNVCFAKFESNRDLLRHCLNYRHESDRICKPCFRSFTSPKLLKSHIETMHATTNMPSVQDRLSPLCHSADTLGEHGFRKSKVKNGNNSIARSKDFSSGLSCNPNKHMGKHSAVLVDCKVSPSSSSSQQSENARLTVLDFESGKVLIDCFIQSHHLTQPWRELNNSTSKLAILKAPSKTSRLMGWKEARAELFKYVNKETIFLGYRLQSKLNLLGISPDNIIDCAILSNQVKAERKSNRFSYLPLESIYRDLFGLQISPNDPMQVCFAVRQVIASHVRYQLTTRIGQRGLGNWQNTS